jgi:hypothetical protein
MVLILIESYRRGHIECSGNDRRVFDRRGWKRIRTGLQNDQTSKAERDGLVSVEPFPEGKSVANFRVLRYMQLNI